jgi:hypothetical protein
MALLLRFPIDIEGQFSQKKSTYATIQMSVLPERVAARHCSGTQLDNFYSSFAFLFPSLLAAVRLHEEGKAQMLRVWHHLGSAGIMRRDWVSASVIVSFAAMMLGVPLIRLLHLQSVVVCPFKQLTGFPCPTCGYTRVFNLLLAGNFAAAIRFQPFVLIIVALSAIAAVLAAASIWKRKDLILPRSLVRGLWAALAASWGWNLYNGV